MSLAFCYPGQGVQHVGMAEGFARSDRYFADMIATASEAAGIDMDQLLYEPNENINITEFTQPALVTACCMITDALLDAGYKPAVTAGLSLGEYCSLYVAGAISFEDAVRLTRLRGKLMSSEVPAGEGSMAAVIGLDKETIESVTSKLDGCWPANFNCPGQIVITGKKTAVQAAIPLLQEAGAKKVVELNVSGPFHSPLLKGAGVSALLSKIIFGLVIGLLSLLSQFGITTIGKDNPLALWIEYSVTTPERLSTSGISASSSSWFVEIIVARYSTNCRG